jgi:hypothetical protein
MCLSGPERTERVTNIVCSLHTCEFFEETNEILDHKPHINLFLTKEINKTEPLAIADAMLFSGLFVPSIAAEGISDKFFYELQGEYKRYLFTFLTIDLSKTQFYILNRQDPIVRQGEMVFHNILFTIVVIESFVFTFLIFKMALIPVFSWLIGRFFNKVRIEPVFEQHELSN